MKPTHLAVAHIAGFRSYAKKFEVAVQWNKLTTLQGRNADNSWRTSAAKEYPSKLNEYLSYSLLQAHVVIRAQCTSIHEPDESFQSDVANLYCGDVQFSQQEMQPDFGGFKDWDAMD